MMICSSYIESQCVMKWMSKSICLSLTVILSYLIDSIYLANLSVKTGNVPVKKKIQWMEKTYSAAAENFNNENPYQTFGNNMD